MGGTGVGRRSAYTTAVAMVAMRRMGVVVGMRKVVVVVVVVIGVMMAVVMMRTGQGRKGTAKGTVVCGAAPSSTERETVPSRPEEVGRGGPCGLAVRERTVTAIPQK